MRIRTRPVSHNAARVCGQSTKLYSHPPELIVEADPDVIMDNAIKQRRPMDASWYRPEATVNQYPRQLIRRYNQQEYDMELDPLVPTISGLQRWAPGWGSPEAFYDTRQNRPDFVMPRTDPTKT